MLSMVFIGPVPDMIVSLAMHMESATRKYALSAGSRRLPSTHCLPGTRIVDFAVWLAFELVLSVLDLMKEWKKIKATL